MLLLLFLLKLKYFIAISGWNLKLMKKKKKVNLNYKVLRSPNAICESNRKVVTNNKLMFNELILQAREKFSFTLM